MSNTMNHWEAVVEQLKTAGLQPLPTEPEGSCDRCGSRAETSPVDTGDGCYQELCSGCVGS